MTLDGEYEPSPEQWVRDQVATYEATGGREANTLPDHPDWPIVVITSRGREVGQAAQEPGDAGRARRGVRRGRLQGRRAGAPGLVPQLPGPPRGRPAGRPEPHTYRARVAEGEERAVWWERAVAQSTRRTLEYQEKTDREIPVFLLERV